MIWFVIFHLFFTCRTIYLLNLEYANLEEAISFNDIARAYDCYLEIRSIYWSVAPILIIFFMLELKNFTPTFSPGTVIYFLLSALLNIITLNLFIVYLRKFTYPHFI